MAAAMRLNEEDHDAVNKPIGDNARKGAVKKRTQLATKLQGKMTWTQDAATGEFMDHKKAPAKKKFKGRKKFTSDVLQHPKSTSGQRMLHKFAPAQAQRQVQSTARSTSPRLFRRTDGLDRVLVTYVPSL
jgi:hypothetical protein